jgi:hypothetical protein
MMNCGDCGGLKHDLKHHLLIVACRCQDYDHVFIGQTNGTEILRCPNCDSAAVTAKEIGYTSPFPTSFGQGFGYGEIWLHRTQSTQFMERSQYQWGLSASADIDTIRWELDFERGQDDYPLHLAWGARFSNRLRRTGLYPDELAKVVLSETEAALWHEHCRSKQDVVSGLRALELYKSIMAEITASELRRALCQQNMAMVLLSLLSLISEEQLGQLVGIRTVRLEALALAKSALAYFEGVGAAIVEAEQERTLIQATIEDLLKIGTV